MATKTILLSTPGTGTWTTPADCDTSVAPTIDVIAGGSNGEDAIFIDRPPEFGGPFWLPGNSGAGGARSTLSSSLTLSAGGTNYYSIGSAGQDTWFNKTSNAVPASTASGALAKGASGTTGGDAASGIGNTKTSGTNGGAGDGGAAGAGSTRTITAGGTAGSGAGGPRGAIGTAGSAYGGGGGGGDSGSGGLGYQGCIIISYTLLPTTRSGTFSKTLSNVTLSSAATTPRNATFAKTLAALTLSSSSQVALMGSLSKTLDNLSIMASGVSGPNRDGLLVLGTLGNLTLSSAGVSERNATLAKTLGSLALSSSATVIGSLAVVNATLGPLRGSLFGVVGSSTSLSTANPLDYPEYVRGVRPVFPQSLGSYVDTELDKVQNTFQNLSVAVSRSPWAKASDAPSGPTEGDVYYDTTLHVTRVWNGTSWNNLW